MSQHRLYSIGSSADKSHAGCRPNGIQPRRLSADRLLGDQKVVKGRIKSVDFVDDHTVVLEKEGKGGNT